MFALPAESNLLNLFIKKFWGSLGDFYEKSPKQVRTESATFAQDLNHTTLTFSTPAISRMRARAASEGAVETSIMV